MAGLIAIGVGCRRGFASEAIVALVRRALAATGDLSGEKEMFTIEGKRAEQNLAEAAHTLGLRLNYLTYELLAMETPRTITRSARVERHIGLPSLAESAALAGAGPHGELIVARIAADGATCAIAYAAKAPP